MIQIGNFFFHKRNALFPLFYFCLFIPSKELFNNYWIAVIVGLTVSLIGQAIRVITIGLRYIIRGGRDRKIYAENLVTDGIFSHCRNPLYVGNILVLLGLAIASNSIFFIVLIIPLFLFIYQSIVLAEEDFLRKKFGNEYEEYARQTNRWLPELKGITGTIKQMHFNWKRVLIKEYNSTYIWMSGFVLLISKHIYVHEGQNTFRGALFLIGMILVTLAALYLFARYLKKSGRIREA